MYDLALLLSMEFIPYKLFQVLTILKFCIMFEKAGNCSLTKRDLVCSKITISENATPKNLHLVMNPQCNCEKQEYQEFHSRTMMICNTSTISVNIGVSLNEVFSKLVLNILLTIL